MTQTAHGAPVAAPAPDGAVIFDQLWCDLAFLHWPVDPADVTKFMPPGARPDVVDGLTYVGLVPFSMRRARIGSRLPVPYVGTLAETNVRLYSVDDAGRHGVDFRSLDCSRALVVAAARAVGVPYVWSRVGVRADGAHRTYTTHRRRTEAASVLEIDIGEPIAPTELEIFLSARWGMHSALRGRPVWVPNHHGAWPLHTATVTRLDDDLVAAAGVAPVGPMLRPLWSPGVHARFGRPRLQRAGAQSG